MRILVGFMLIPLLLTVSLCVYYVNTTSNRKYLLSIEDCIYSNPNVQTLVFQQKSTKLTINYITNSTKNCINPNFPSIHITGDNYFNGWIHIITTDSKNSNLKKFIDKDNKNPPFYSINRDFYDAPLWNIYTTRDKIRFWEGHAYPIKIDYTNKNIKIFDGIKWGFVLKNLKKPSTLLPQTIEESEIEEDLYFLKTQIKDFTLIKSYQ